MEPKVGQVSGVLEEREHGFPRGSKRWAGRDYGWQTQESFEKVLSMRRGGAFFDFTRKYIGDPITQAITSSDVYQENIEPLMQMMAPVAEQVEPIIRSSAIGQTLEDAEIVTEAAREELSQRGWDPRGADLGRMLAEEAVGGVAGKTLGMAGKLASSLPPPGGGMALATATAGVSPTPPVSKPRIQGGSVFMSTTSPEWTSPKAGLGSAESPQFKPAVETYKRRRSIYTEVVDDLKAAYEKGEVSAERLKKALAKIGKHEKGVMSTFPYDEANPEAYLTDLRVSPAYRQERAGQRGVLSKLEEEFGRVDPYDVTKPAQQHHVLAKAETKPFVDTLLKLIDSGIGNDDDLVNFFVWPEKYELYPGNVVKNLLDMGEITHTVAQKDPMALHKILDMAGLEFGGRTKARIIKDYGLDKVTNVDELMQAYDRYLQEIAVPSRDISYKVHDWWYDKTVKTLKGKELAEFKANYSRLSDPRKIK